MSLVKSLFKYLSLMSFFTFLFFFFLFPFNDLSQLVTDQVSKASQNQVYLEFQNINLSVMPIGIRLEAVNFETQKGLKLKLDGLTLRPSLSGVLKKQPFGFVEAEGFMKGQAQISLSGGTASEKGDDRYQLVVQGDSLKLEELKNLITLPVALEGRLNTEITALFPPELTEQPESDFLLNFTNFKIPSSSLNLGAFGFITLPEIKMKKIDIKGRMQNGNLVIENIQLGQPGDELTGSIKGQVQMNLRKINNTVQPVMGPYNLDVRLNVKPELEKKINYVFLFLQPGKTATPGQYNFKLTGTGPQAPPQISALR